MNSGGPGTSGIQPPTRRIRDATTHSMISLEATVHAAGIMPELTAAAVERALRLNPRVGKPLRGCPGHASETTASGNPRRRRMTARQDNTDKHRTLRVQRGRTWSPTLSLHLSLSSPSNVLRAMGARISYVLNYTVVGSVPQSSHHPSSLRTSAAPTSQGTSPTL